MTFEWDEAKRHSNLQKHGIDFVDAVRVFDKDFILVEDNRREYGEIRFIAFGMLLGNLIVVAYTEREENIIRIISARKASKNESRQYYRHIAN